MHGLVKRWFFTLLDLCVEDRGNERYGKTRLSGHRTEDGSIDSKELPGDWRTPLSSTNLRRHTALHVSGPVSAHLTPGPTLPIAAA